MMDDVYSQNKYKMENISPHFSNLFFILSPKLVVLLFIFYVDIKRSLRVNITTCLNLFSNFSFKLIVFSITFHVTIKQAPYSNIESNRKKILICIRNWKTRGMLSILYSSICHPSFLSFRKNFYYTLQRKQISLKKIIIRVNLTTCLNLFFNFLHKLFIYFYYFYVAIKWIIRK